MSRITKRRAMTALIGGLLVLLALLVADKLSNDGALSSSESIFDVESINGDDDNSGTSANHVADKTLNDGELPSFNGVYYVDSINGDDDNSGVGINQPWKSLEKVNSIVFKPGDTILFAADGAWEGQLHPQGSGDEGNPISIGMYGEGSKPSINGNGRDGSVVLLHNQSYWEISDLAVTNDDDLSRQKNFSKRKGVEIRGEDAGQIDHIYLRNLDVHNVDGSFEKTDAGIMFLIVGDDEKTWFDDVLVEGCTIEYVDRTGIMFRSSWSRWSDDADFAPSTNVVVRNNYLAHIGGDGIIICETDGALIEYNVCDTASEICDNSYPCAGIWAWDSDNALFQYNEVFNTQQTWDGQAYDIDYLSNDIVYQYNYSHDNLGGFILICSPDTFQKDGTQHYNRNGIVRYNISQNDGTRSINLMGHATTGTKIHNNTIYIGPESTTMKVIENYSWGGLAREVFIENNIFYVENGAELDDKDDWYYSHNVYYGVKAPKEDGNAITADPMLAAVGSGGIGLDSVDGYKLLSGSPCIGTGKTIESDAVMDYWGNPLNQGIGVNMGAYGGNGEIE